MKKVAVVSLSGNVGKSTVAQHVFLPRIPDAKLITVETINADEGSDGMVRGDQWGQLQEELMMMDAAVVDVGASNIESFVKLMQQYRGSHEEFDMFVVPTVKDSKQIKDTIATIQALKAMGVPAKKITVVFNKLAPNETVEEEFFPLFQYHEQFKAFTLRPSAAIEYSELYHKLRAHKTSIPELLSDATDYKAKMREATTQEDKHHWVSMVSMRRLAMSAVENLDLVFNAVTKK
ncbi:StbB family protein [Pseudomonas protegens]|uniref:StbB family protein n=1 Tax=Pseudomonas protegens TaxID=380021 RepID=UPI0023EBFF3A|nr:StbB family protein [Pseudomonas protegens]MDF4211164.1 StbB family protein [Pseudomonas protegens]